MVFQGRGGNERQIQVSDVFHVGQKGLEIAVNHGDFIPHGTGIVDHPDHVHPAVSRRIQAKIGLT